MGCGGEAAGHLGVPGPVGVQVGGVQRVGGDLVGGLDDRSVELVAGDPGAGGGEQVVRGGVDGAVGKGEARRHASLGVDRAHHGSAVDAAAEVEQPRALGDRRDARRHGVQQRSAQWCVGREPGGVDLREAPAEIEARRALGQGLVGERVERDDLAARRFEQLGGLGVAEGEGAPTGHRDDRTAIAGRRELGRPRSFVEIGGLVRETNDLLEVDGLGDAVGQPVKGVRGVVAFRCRHESEVTRRGDDAVVAMQHAQHRESGGLERAAHLVGMPLRAGLVEDDADDAHRRVERNHALHDRGDRAGRVRDVDDEDDRTPGHGGDVGGGGEPVAADLPVVQTHDALDDRDVRSVGAMKKQRDEPFLADQVRVEVPAGAAGGEGVVAGVDVVGADLVARDGVAGSTQRRHQARWRPSSCRDPTRGRQRQVEEG